MIYLKSRGIDKRVLNEAEYFINNEKATVRKVAEKFGVSKSTVHLDLTERLKNISPILYPKVREKLDYNKSIRHVRGGDSTKLNYKSSSR